MSPTQPTPCEAPLSNHHSLQLIQSNQLHFLHTVKALISHLKQPQVGHEGQIQFTPFQSIAAVVLHDQFFKETV